MLLYSVSEETNLLFCEETNLLFVRKALRIVQGFTHLSTRILYSVSFLTDFERMV